jgi:hypothetical protein
MKTEDTTYFAYLIPSIINSNERTTGEAHLISFMDLPNTPTNGMVMHRYREGRDKYFDNFFTLEGHHTYNTISESGNIFEHRRIAIPGGSYPISSMGWFDRWGKCVGDQLSYMAGGSVDGSITGLVCIVFGVPGAISLAATCAVVAFF